MRFLKKVMADGSGMSLVESIETSYVNGQFNQCMMQMKEFFKGKESASSLMTQLYDDCGMSEKAVARMFAMYIDKMM